MKAHHTSVLLLPAGSKGYYMYSYSMRKMDSVTITRSQTVTTIIQVIIVIIQVIIEPVDSITKT